MQYTKPFQTFDELADKVQKRGLGGSRETLIFALQTVGYYRLSGYWYPFHTDDVFHNSATIEAVMRIYDFDRQFRLIMLNALEHIEIYIRTQLAHKVSRDYGPFGYLDRTGLPRLCEKEHAHFIEKCHLLFERSREPFVIHYQQVYGEGDKKKLPPLWMMVNYLIVLLKSAHWKFCASATGWINLMTGVKTLPFLVMFWHQVFATSCFYF